jgi:hypothetical protein
MSISSETNPDINEDLKDDLEEFYEDLDENTKRMIEIDSYCLKNKDKVFKIGFWKYFYETDTYVDFLPTPIKNTSSLTEEEKLLFLEKLEEIERNSYMKYYLGFSQCRICLIENGSIEYYYKKNDKIYVFPSGYIHYVRDHNVKVDEWFYKMVMGLEENISFEEKYNIEDID